MFLSERKLRRLFADHDFVIHSVRHNKHWVVKASHGEGPGRLFTLPVTPSDIHALKNIASLLKRSKAA